MPSLLNILLVAEPGVGTNPSLVSLNTSNVLGDSTAPPEDTDYNKFITSLSVRTFNFDVGIGLGN